MARPSGTLESLSFETGPVVRIHMNLVPSPFERESCIRNKRLGGSKANHSRRVRTMAFDIPQTLGKPQLEPEKRLTNEPKRDSLSNVFLTTSHLMFFVCSVFVFFMRGVCYIRMLAGGILSITATQSSPHAPRPNATNDR